MSKYITIQRRTKTVSTFDEPIEVYRHINVAGWPQNYIILKTNDNFENERVVLVGNVDEQTFIEALLEH